MTFKESIISVYIKNYSNFHGKASRSELWWAALFYFIVSFAGIFIIAFIVGMINPTLGEEGKKQMFDYFSLFLTIIILLPAAAVNTRRFHDVGKSTKEALTIFVVYLLSLMFIRLTRVGAIVQTNEFLTFMMSLVFFISFAYLLYIYVKKPVQ
jgi:uncharacterized membrane protein YhaH (DUF805 family)|tara:strand:- start:25 stop:483 length:459 start_codon:yes stop_codon:yes gene_type:complete